MASPSRLRDFARESSPMTDDRPNPDELLARVQAEEAEARRGRLKIFFGCGRCREDLRDA